MAATKLKDTPKGAQAKANSQDAPPSLTPLQVLLALENEAFNAPDRLALKHQAVNNPRQLLDVGHIFWITRSARNVKIAAMSSQSEVNKSSPFIQDLCHLLKAHAKAGKLNSAQSLLLTHDDTASNITPDFEYVFPNSYFAPFAPHSSNGGLLFTRAAEFDTAQTAIMIRLAKTYGAIWSALSAKPRAVMSRRKKLGLSGGVILLALIGLIPVPIVTLAPAEIVADKPFIIAAPMDGVVENILIPPNSAVEAGAPLVKMADTEFKSEFDVAVREESVALARLKKASLTSFIDDAAKRELTIARAETELARARTLYAKTRLGQTDLSAPKGGLAIYSNPQDWAGRPVATGETIIEIANPKQVILKINAPLLSGDSLKAGARVRVFMDSDPLQPLEAEIERASYYAAPTADGQMAYETYARLSSPYALPRIGARGVAKIYGNTAPLIFWLARRPLAALRQFTGF